MTIKEKRDRLVSELGEDWVAEQIDFPAAIEHYHKGLFTYDMSVTDCDDWAWLNTLFRYDIGGERAKAIIRWFYENMDTTVQDAVDAGQKETLQNICELELGFRPDFSRWPDKDPNQPEYGFKEYFAWEPYVSPIKRRLKNRLFFAPVTNQTPRKL